MTGSELWIKRGWLRKHWYDWPGGGRRVCGDELWKLSEICWLSLVETVSSHSEHCSPQHQTLHSPPDTGDNHCRRSLLHLENTRHWLVRTKQYSPLIGWDMRLMIWLLFQHSLLCQVTRWPAAEKLRVNTETKWSRDVMCAVPRDTAETDWSGGVWPDNRAGTLSCPRSCTNW